MTALRFQTGGDIRHPRPPFGGLECSNKILSQDTLAYDDISTDQVSLQKSKQFMRYSRDKKKLKIDHISLCCDLDLEIAHNAASPYHVW